MIRGATTRFRHFALPRAGVLAILVSVANPASAQIFRIETLLGDYDPLEEVPLEDAWVNYPSALATDSAGNLYFVDRDTYRVRKVDPSGRVSTVAGSGLIGFSGDGGPATSARLGVRVEGLAVDGRGNIYIADTDNYRIRRIDPSGIIETVAGTGTWGTGGDGGPARSAGLTAVYGLAADSAGNVYVADTWDDKIRKIDPEGTISTIAGTGDEGHSGDGGPATHAALNRPRGVAVDAAGSVYIADRQNHRVRRVDPSGTIATIAGTGDRGYSGDGGLATEAELADPYAVAVDAAGNVYIADSRNRIVRKVDPEGTISTVAGIARGTDDSSIDVRSDAHIAFPRALAVGLSGELYIADSYADSILRLDGEGAIAEFVGLGQPEVYRPGGVAVDSGGNVLVADSWNHRVIKVDASGIVSTVAGSGEAGASGDGGPAPNAELAFPRDVAVDDAGNVYIADTANSRIRIVDSRGTIATIAGTGDSGYAGDGGPATSARFNGPTAVAVDANGAVFVADSGNHRIRKIDAAGIVTTVAGNGQDGEIQPGVLATQTPMGWPADVAVDSQGRIYISDDTTHRVFRVDGAGMITVAVGTGESGALGDAGPASRAQLHWPRDVAVSDSDTLYIADSFNNSIRRVTSDGIITTIAGSGIDGYDGDGAPATMFALNSPIRVAADSDETVIVVDDGNHRIRVLTAETPRPAISSILNGASYVASVAPGSVAVLRGTDFASGISAVKELPQAVALPTALLETSVIVSDRTETSWARRVAGLYSVSPTEIRFHVPEKTAKGLVIMTVDREGTESKALAIRTTSVAPGLFSANGDGLGVAAASAARVARDGTRTALDVSRFDAVRRRYVAVPLNVREDLDPVYLTLVGTGMRGGSGPPSVTIGGQDVPVESSGPASGFHGVEELVVGPIPGSVQGQDLDIVAIVDGQASNAVTIAVD